MPTTVILLTPSTVKLMPAGASTYTGWEKPSANSTPLSLIATR